MLFMLKAGGIVGSILVLIALVITLLKGLIGLIGFITGAIKILIVLVFVALIVGVGFLIFKSLSENRRPKD